MVLLMLVFDYHYAHLSFNCCFVHFSFSFCCAFSNFIFWFLKSLELYKFQFWTETSITEQSPDFIFYLISVSMNTFIQVEYSSIIAHIVSKINIKTKKITHDGTSSMYHESYEFVHEILINKCLIFPCGGNNVWLKLHMSVFKRFCRFYY